MAALSLLPKTFLYSMLLLLTISLFSGTSLRKKPDDLTPTRAVLRMLVLSSVLTDVELPPAVEEYLWLYSPMVAAYVDCLCSKFFC